MGPRRNPDDWHLQLRCARRGPGRAPPASVAPPCSPRLPFRTRAGKLNYFAGKKAADRGKSALYPDVDFCTNPGAICSAEYPSLRWFAGLFYWIADVEPYDVRNAKYIDTLKKWVDDGMDVNDHSLIDFASGVVNRGCHDAPYNVGDADPCGNGLLHARDERRMNFKYMWSILAPLAG